MGTKAKGSAGGGGGGEVSAKFVDSLGETDKKTGINTCTVHHTHGFRNFDLRVIVRRPPANDDTTHCSTFVLSAGRRPETQQTGFAGIH